MPTSRPSRSGTAGPDSDLWVDLPAPPAEIDRLTAVEDLPRYMAIFMAGLAAAAISFATATTVRQRRRDLAVLRVLGMTARHVRSVVVVLVLALTGFGALLGGALGIIVGPPGVAGGDGQRVAAVLTEPAGGGGGARPARRRCVLAQAGRQHQPPGGRADPRRRRAEDRVMAHDPAGGAGTPAETPAPNLPTTNGDDVK